MLLSQARSPIRPDCARLPSADSPSSPYGRSVGLVCERIHKQISLNKDTCKVREPHAAHSLRGAKLASLGRA
jgi:hypothetical protein